MNNFLYFTTLVDTNDWYHYIYTLNYLFKVTAIMNRILIFVLKLI